jgi:nicotinamide-nucleotide amidase
MELIFDFDALQTQVGRLADALRARGLRLVTAESCTGGLIAAVCTSVAGSSEWFERGFVTYTNESKTAQLGVDTALIATDGAVSRPVALAMAEGALRNSLADVAVAVTGIAGPGGAVPGKPVGTVWLAWAWFGRPFDAPGCVSYGASYGASDGVGSAADRAGPSPGEGVDRGRRVEAQAECLHLPGDRTAVRSQTVAVALARLLTLLTEDAFAGASAGQAPVDESATAARPAQSARAAVGTEGDLGAEGAA